MDKDVLRVVDLVLKSDNSIILIWNYLLPRLEDVEILKMLTKRSGKEIRIVPLVEIVRNINNKNVTIIQ
ncbi:hypothetical protein PMX22_19795 [Clostridium butyricum]|jgi:hypothetical protein|uniref:hypothetical protein n=1 Tax=Clostridium butyricum TaxID=1492 RepID=UPI0020590C62|nr:hypothetical protein [Clostridium butyricum]MDB2162032.1 hypothetical protein [Clostridium butyricum]DAQ97574.1 MAG TPA: hypothetical protein [Caudoviricetes sp.]